LSSVIKILIELVACDADVTRLYSKSGCEYDCAIHNAIEKCQCRPWNIPHDAADNFCDLYGNACFDLAMETFAYDNCSCPSDCSGTYFSVFESSQPLASPSYFCTRDQC
jgi:hypothetical protein